MIGTRATFAKITALSLLFSGCVAGGEDSDFYEADDAWSIDCLNGDWLAHGPENGSKLITWQLYIENFEQGILTISDAEAPHFIWEGVAPDRAGQRTRDIPLLIEELDDGRLYFSAGPKQPAIKWICEPHCEGDLTCHMIDPDHTPLVFEFQDY